MLSAYQENMLKDEKPIKYGHNLVNFRQRAKKFYVVYIYLGQDRMSKKIHLTLLSL
jgi:hypothetical protein